MINKNYSTKSRKLQRRSSQPEPKDHTMRLRTLKTYTLLEIKI